MQNMHIPTDYADEEELLMMETYQETVKAIANEELLNTVVK
jgi:hypothetical protein